MASPLAIQSGPFLTSTDGTWCTFPLSVGPSKVYVIPSTASTIDYVVYESACELQTGQGLNTSCAANRGGVYNPTYAQTHQVLGTGNITIDSYLGVTSQLNETLFLTDIVQLGYEGEGGPMLNNSLIAAFEAPAYNLGYLGILPIGISLGGTNRQSYFQTLYTQGQIPSQTFGYTAGSQDPSRNSSSASLVFGGYDANRFTSNGFNFPIVETDTYGAAQYLSLQLNSITANGTTLLGDAISVTLDSTLPYMWLPSSVCEAMASQFNLTYDSSSSMYFVNDSAHTMLLQQNPEFSFTFQTPQLDMVNITVPYSAFDLAAQYPLVPSTQNYFPLKQSNGSAYALGRAFLQYAYILANFDTMSFSVSQVTPLTTNYTAKIVAIYSNVTTAPNPPSKSSGSNAGAIAGGVVGGVVGAAIIAFLIWFFVIRKRRDRHDADRERQEPSAAELPVTQRQPLPEKNPNGPGAFSGSGHDAPGIGSPGSEHLPIYPATGELAGSEHGFNRYELDGAQHSELPVEREDGNNNAVGATDTETGTGAGTGADTLQEVEETEPSHNTTTNKSGSGI